MNYSESIKISENIYIKYNLPRKIRASETIGKEFDCIIEGDSHVYVLFKDNTFTAMSTYEESLSVMIDGNPDYTEIIDDLFSKFPEAYHDHKNQLKTIREENDKNFKLGQYEKLKKELGL